MENTRRLEGKYLWLAVLAHFLDGTEGFCRRRRQAARSAGVCRGWRGWYVCKCRFCGCGLCAVETVSLELSVQVILRWGRPWVPPAEAMYTSPVALDRSTMY
ncbi:hypothetical protein FB451DRAFT_1292627 [Mycena latifolia]|nr:hypothetical protein FB451DRAFT_1292627 [Mycena latifolia]